MRALPAVLADRLAGILLANLDRTYPYHLTIVLDDDADLRPPRELTPIFAGCFDWHSAVHSHWALVRLRGAASRAVRERVDAALDARLTADAVARELSFLAGRRNFELPYGLAWLLALAAELRGAPPAWGAALAPLERLARDRLVAWARQLPAPIRTGEHAQSAFAIGLALDWATVAADAAATADLTAAAERHHGDDRDAPLHLEPGGHDFLSPSLSVAALVAQLRGPVELAAWLDRFAPRLGRAKTLTPVTPVDRADGKLVHWDGLNLSRAWMLWAIAAALPPIEPRAVALRALAAAHGAAGIAALDGQTYAGSHWLPSFAVRWLTV
jgi:hypothetical protein